MDTKKHSGFEAPTIGILVPDGTTWKKNPDGTMTPIYPKKKGEANEAEKKTPKKKK